MSWDENLFKVLFDKINKLKNHKKNIYEKNKAELISLSPSLKILANALAEKNIDLFPTRIGFGVTRTNSLVLPIEINIFKKKELNEQLYLCRTAFSALVIRENTKKQLNDNWFESVTEIFNKEFSGLVEMFTVLDFEAKNLIDQNAWITLSRGTFPKNESLNNDTSEEQILTLETTTKKSSEVKNLKPTLAKRKEIKTDDTNPAVHVFEKALTADDYQGGKRDIDSDEDSSDMSTALSELNMDQVVKAQGETGASYTGGLFLDEVSNITETHRPITNEKNIFYYPEWSKRKLKFLPNWCTLYEEKHTQPVIFNNTNVYNIKSEAIKLKRCLEIIVNNPIWKRGLEDGSELDLDSVIRYKADIKSGSSLIKNLYTDRIKSNQDIALLILADTSLSTDAWISNKRVFNTIQESLLLLSESLKELTTNVSIAAFYSNTRNHCTYLRLKDFNENWKSTKEQIQMLSPQGYTRMGPAIRHATSILEKINSRKKILLIISDSKPTDYDAYEGIHGESDVHHAILESRNKNIITKGLAIASNNSGHVKRIFGRNGFDNFTDTKELAQLIIKTYSAVMNS